MASVQDDGKLLLTFNHDSLPDTNYYFQDMRVQYFEESYSWYGESFDPNETENKSGSFFSISKSINGSIISSINIKGFVFKGITVGEDLALFELRIPKEIQYHCDSFDSIPDTNIVTGPVDYSFMKTCDNNCEVQLLVLYTQKAADKADNILFEIDEAISRTNLLFANSGINDCHVRLNVVSKQLFSFPYVNYTTGPFTPLHVRNPLFNLFSNYTAQTLRTSSGADAVILIDGDEILDTGFPGYTAGFKLEIERMYSIVPISMLNNGSWAFQHQLGHLFSARHKRNQNSDETNYNGWSFVNGFFTNKVLSYTVVEQYDDSKPGLNQIRIPYYSNPFIQYYDGHKLEPTGSVSDASAFAFINESCTVSELYPQNQVTPFLAYITGDKFSCPCKHTILEVTATGGPSGTGTYSYEWRKSTDGLNYSGVIGTSANYSIQASCTPGEIVYAKVTVTSGGTSIESIGQIKSSNQPYGLPCALKKDLTSVNEVIKSEYLDIYPNPGKDKFTITNTSKFISGEKLIVYDLTGKPIVVLTIPSNGSKFEFDLSQLPNGYYILKKENNNLANEYVSFIISK